MKRMLKKIIIIAVVIAAFGAMPAAHTQYFPSSSPRVERVHRIINNTIKAGGMAYLGYRLYNSEVVSRTVNSHPYLTALTALSAGIIMGPAMYENRATLNEATNLMLDMGKLIILLPVACVVQGIADACNTVKTAIFGKNDPF